MGLRKDEKLSSIAQNSSSDSILLSTPVFHSKMLFIFLHHSRLLSLAFLLIRSGSIFYVNQTHLV